jgi:DNA-directed RNA polymerase subunit RPC12/RpoP
MQYPQPIRLPPDDGVSVIAPRRRRDDYTVSEKAAIARKVVTRNARIECPRCEDRLELVGVPAAGGGSIEVVWDFQCPGCRRRVLLTHLPEDVSRAS